MIEPAVLWNKFRQGDDESFSALFSLYFEALYQYGMTFCVNTDLVKDSIQDVFINLYSHGNLPPVSNPKFYLFRALKNNIINKLIKEKQIRTISLQDLPFMAEYELHQIENSSEDDVENLETEIQTILELLPPRQKEAIYLRFEQNMTYEEVSEILNMNYQSTRNLVFRAMKNLRRHIELCIPFLTFISFLR